MPLYHFKLVDNHIVSDHGAHSLTDKTSAQIEAIRLARSVRAARPEVSRLDGDGDRATALACALSRARESRCAGLQGMAAIRSRAPGPLFSHSAGCPPPKIAAA
jgi:hypothetical protein